MTDDRQLLSQFVDGGSQEAFAMLVRRHANLVYSAALRQLGGDTHLARDATQGVFVALALAAPRLRNSPALTGWLYTTARFVAAKIVRTRQRQKLREQEAQTMHDLQGPDATDPDWNALRPLLDATMHALNERERESILLRYFEGRSFAEVGTLCGLNENAARMRAERALEKLRARLIARGITSTAAVLGAALSAQSVTAAPVGLIQACSSLSIAAGSTTLIGATRAIAMTTLQKVLILGTITVLAGAGLYETIQVSHLKKDIRALQQTNAETTLPPAAILRPSFAALENSGQSGGYAQMAGWLRSVGMPERMIRIFIRAILDANLAAKRGELMKNEPLWRETLTPAMLATVRQIERENRQVMTSLFGPTGNDEDTDPQLMLREFGTLAPNKVSKLQQIKADYEDLTNLSEWSGLSPAEIGKQKQMLDAEQTADIQKLLTPDEFAQYTMSHSTAAVELYRSLGTIDASDQQFAAMFPLREAYDGQSAAPGANHYAALLQFYAGISTVLTPEQFQEYVSANDDNYNGVKAVTDQFSINPSIAMQVAQLEEQMGSGAVPQAQGAQQIISLLGPSASAAFAAKSYGRWMARYLPK